MHQGFMSLRQCQTWFRSITVRLLSGLIIYKIMLEILNRCQICKIASTFDSATVLFSYFSFHFHLDHCILVEMFIHICKSQWTSKLEKYVGTFYELLPIEFVHLTVNVNNKWIFLPVHSTREKVSSSCGEHFFPREKEFSDFCYLLTVLRFFCLTEIELFVGVSTPKQNQSSIINWQVMFQYIQI